MNRLTVLLAAAFAFHTFAAETPIEAIRAKLPNAKLIWASSTPVLLEGDVKKLDPVINGTVIDHNRRVGTLAWGSGHSVKHVQFGRSSQKQVGQNHRVVVRFVMG